MRKGQELIDFCRWANTIFDAEETGEHYLLASGRHSRIHIQLSRALGNFTVGHAIAGVAFDEIDRLGLVGNFDTILTAAIGAIPLGVALQYAFLRMHKLPPDLAYAEKSGEGYVLNRFALGSSNAVLIVDDIHTSGKTLNALYEVCLWQGACVVAEMAVINRGAAPLMALKKPASGRFKFSLADYPLADNEWQKDECPYCLRRVPLVKDGVRVEVF